MPVLNEYWLVLHLQVFASDYTRENTAKVRNIPGEQVQDRLHPVVVVIFPDPTYLKIGTLKRASVYTLERKEKKLHVRNRS